ncbi:MAG TPA: hypothetical protein VMW17_03260 [Candidatus Binatia bacterium]|nr:hypothetical protein [Candidatus Binatia bacterium]
MGASVKWRFALQFLITFALLVFAWQVGNFATYYRTAVLASARAVSPPINGWWLEYDRPGVPGGIAFRSANQRLPMLLDLPALSMGLMPLISLIVATPGMTWRRIVVTALIGSALYLLVHVAVVLVYPLIMVNPNPVKDTVGVFSGLVAFVVAPLGLWFVLTYPVLRTLWQLAPLERPTRPR